MNGVNKIKSLYVKNPNIWFSIHHKEAKPNLTKYIDGVDINRVKDFNFLSFIIN